MSSEVGFILTSPPEGEAVLPPPGTGELRPALSEALFLNDLGPPEADGPGDLTLAVLLIDPRLLLPPIIAAGDGLYNCSYSTK